MEINQRVFWANVKTLRESKGLTQQGLATQLGLNYKSYNNRERGFAAAVRPSLAEKIATALGTTVEELCQGEAPDEPLIRPEFAVFWNNAKARRGVLGLSQDEVAKRIGSSPTAYQAKEAKKAPKLPKDLAENVARALETTVEELMRSDTDIKEEPQTPMEAQAPIVPNDPKQPTNEPPTFETHPQTSQQEQPIKLDNLYNLDHLPKRIREFISDPSNKDAVIEMYLDS